MTTTTAPVALITPDHPPQPARSDDDERRVRAALETERRERAMQRSALLMLPPR